MLSEYKQPSSNMEIESIKTLIKNSHGDIFFILNFLWESLKDFFEHICQEFPEKNESFNCSDYVRNLIITRQKKTSLTLNSEKISMFVMDHLLRSIGENLEEITLNKCKINYKETFKSLEKLCKNSNKFKIEISENLTENDSLSYGLLYFKITKFKFIKLGNMILEILQIPKGIKNNINICKKLVISYFYHIKSFFVDFFNNVEDNVCIRMTVKYENNCLLDLSIFLKEFPKLDIFIVKNWPITIENSRNLFDSLSESKKKNRDFKIFIKDKLNL